MSSGNSLAAFEEMVDAVTRENRLAAENAQLRQENAELRASMAASKEALRTTQQILANLANTITS